jgi:hypothetical protein
MKKLFVGFMLCVSAVTVFAQKEAVYTGVGVYTCKQYVEKTQSNNGVEKELLIGMIESWLQGYLSGRNRQLDVLGYKPVNIDSVKQLGAMLTFACANVAKTELEALPIFMLIDKVYEENFASRVQKK